MITASNPPALGAEAGTIWLPNQSAPGAINRVATWEQVMSLIEASSSPEHVWFGNNDNGPYNVPGPASYNTHGVILEQRYVGPNTNVNVADGVTIDNMRAIWGCRVLFRPTSGQSLAFSDLAPGEIKVLLTRLGASVANIGSVPLLTLHAGDIFVYGCFDQSSGFEGGSTAPLVHLADPGAVCAVFCGFTSPNCQLPPIMATGVVGSVFAIVHDGTIGQPFPTFPGVLGTVANNPVGCVGGTGTTAQRPVPALWPIQDGCMYRDLDINKTIWWSRASNFWVDAFGVGPQ
jgi:hypothetical protein